MKLLCCRGCFDWVALSWKDRACDCGRTGGKYNADGDTATLWGDGVLYGFSNRAWRPLHVHALTDGSTGKPDLAGVDGNDVLWLYDESNGKITRLEAGVDA